MGVDARDSSRPSWFDYRHYIMGVHSIPRQWAISLLSAFGVIAALKSAPSDRMLDPFMLFVVPGALLFMMMQVRRFLKQPRTEDFAFVTGISYSDRKRCTGWYIDETLRTILISTACMAVLFVSIRYILCGTKELQDSGALAVIVLIEAVGGMVLTKVLLRLRWEHPISHDRVFRIKIDANGTIVPWAKTLGRRAVWWGSNLIAGVAPKGIRPYVVRQLLYFGYREPIVFFGSFVAAITVAVSVIVLSEAQSLTGRLFTLAYAPVLVLFANASTFFESVDNLWTCPYYPALGNKVVQINILCCALLVAPFGLLSGMVDFRGAGSASFVLVLCLLDITFVFAYVLSYRTWTGPRGLLLVLTLSSVFVAIASTSPGVHWAWGGASILPLALVGLTFQLGNRRSAVVRLNATGRMEQTDCETG